MKAMKRGTALAVTLGVWVAALGSAAALTYDLNRVPNVAQSPEPAVAVIAPRQAAPVKPAAEPQPVLTIPTVTIVAQAPRMPVAKVAKPRVDISAMRCSDWRSLDMGSGRVQICQ